MPHLYAIGDIHGRRDLLDPLLDAIVCDAGEHGDAPRIVFLGDIVDRGPESRQSLDRVIATLEAFPGSRLILGNHEEFMLRFIDEPERRDRIAKTWFANGGLETIASYGFGKSDNVDAIAARIAEERAAHIDALRAADWMVETERYCFVHGGVDPMLPLADQDPETTRWIRHDFLDYSDPLEKMVIHGHTPTDASLPEVHANRIAVDTGAFRSGHLTCAILDETGETPPRFLATDDHGSEIAVTAVDPLNRP
ncbi:metallophosphoesterase [Oricola sp.]|uniref:metallophosphoesterase n=1 Tax=Oricola sp. TaxID=1979950 RepID=UPI003515721E